MTDLPSPLLDIGTGAGFPAIPLKIASPETHIIMAEGRKKRIEFLKEALELLALEGIEIEARRIAPGFDRPVAGVITRALESMEDTLERVKHCVKPGGVVLFMKGPRCEEEVRAAEKLHGKEYRLLENKAYTIPHTPHRRRLVVFHRKRTPVPKEAGSFSGRVFRISSSSNRTLVRFKKLLSGRGIRKAGEAILAGERVVREVLKGHGDSCVAWISTEDFPPPEKGPPGLVWYCLTPPLYKSLDLFGTGAPLLLIRFPPLLDWRDEETWPKGCTLFIPFQDPENVGSVIRSAVAFGVSRVVLLKEAAHPFLPKACRAAGACVLKLPLLNGPALEDLKPEGNLVFALSTSGRNIRVVRFPKRFGFLAGLEGQGLPERFRTQKSLYIPMEPGCESLNAAAAVSVALYAWRSSLFTRDFTVSP
jgi:16S rRNA (guanine527-N7)-methyltransferase